MKTPTNHMPASLAFKQVLVALFWGGTFIGGRVLAQAMPLTVAAFGRYLIASLLLVWVAFRMEGGLPRLNRQQVFSTALLGLTGVFLYNLFFFGALAHIPAGRTALFVTLSPVTVAVCSAVFFGERLGRLRWLGIVLALVGAAVIITRGDLAGTVQDIGRSFGRGELSMLCAVLAWVAYTLLSRRALVSLSPIAATTYSALWGCLFLGLSAAGHIASVDWTALGWPVWAALFYMGAFGTVVAFVWYYQGIRAAGPSKTVIFTNLVPLFGVLLSALLLGESVLLSMVVGGALSIAGVMMVNHRAGR
ncbi:DMT family transporter [Neisseria zalophi]|uniref:DMT family transporter n=1 Tax=Neisseria zalophi TaxID=640030 RepID=A0A5J6PUX2_9NEIS|nr:DMT family transporter [Neisseria zalophi]QEY26355.1 DMT family transporter [Neisseria zalophi]